MKQLELKDVSSKMRKMDICMMATQAEDGSITTRPMSNNGDVEYDGNSYFFSYEDMEVIHELKSNNAVNLAFQGDDKLYISVVGKAELVTDKGLLKEHWLDELKAWFKEGIDTPGIVMIQVKAERVKLWNKEEEGEFRF